MTSSDVFGINPGLAYGDPFPPIVTYHKHQKTNYSDFDAAGNARKKDVYNNYYDTSTTTTEISTLNALNQLTSKSVNFTTIPYGPAKNYQINPLTYDDNGNLLREHYTEARPIDSQYSYGLDNQLLWNLSETTHGTFTKPDNTQVDCYNRTEKWYTYELGGLLRRIKSKIHDSENPHSIYDANYNDILYYSHDGVIVELHDDTSKYKYTSPVSAESCWPVIITVQLTSISRTTAAM